MLGGDVIHEEQHPRAQGVDRGLGFAEATLGGGELLDLALIDRADQVIAGRKVSVERTRSNAGFFGDVVETGVGAMAGEGLFGDFEEALAIAERVRAGLARRGLGSLGWHMTLLRR